MPEKTPSLRSLAIAMILAVITVAAGCAPTVVVIGSPYERFDHNRTRKIVVVTGGAGPAVPREVVDEVYSPSGSTLFPAAQYRGNAGAPDRLPAANVVPVFTGVPLPLSKVPVSGGRSDRSDLVDFLTDGSFVQSGVEPGSMTGDLRATEKAYKPILDLLGSRERLTGNRKALLKKWSSLNFDVGDEVIDARYRRRAFVDVVPLKYREFWFILYKLPGRTFYSRLVVIPVHELPEKVRRTF